MEHLLGEPFPELCTEYKPDAKLVLLEGDCQNTLRQVPSESVRLVVTSPPYNLGKEYEDHAALGSYLQEMRPILEELARVLAPDGNLCWEVGNYVDAGEIVPLDIAFYPLFKSLGFKLRNRIIWHFEHGLHASRRFSGRYETICWFTKGDSYVFNLDAVRMPAKYPGKTHFKGPKRGLPSGNPLGKNPSDFWSLVEQEWHRGIWDIPNVKANHPEKTTHPCQFPIELVQRCILALSNEGDWVLDPFGGVGSTMIAAVMHDRKAILCEKEPKYLQLARRRLEEFFSGQLKIRPLGKPVFQPTGREKVSRVPSLWPDRAGGPEK